DPGVLSVEVVRCRVPVGLVLGEVALPEGRRVADVERDRDVVGTDVLQQVDEELGADVDGLHRLPARTRQVAARRVVRAEELGVPVDDVEGLHWLPLVFGAGQRLPLARRRSPPCHWDARAEDPGGYGSRFYHPGPTRPGRQQASSGPVWWREGLDPRVAVR